MTRSAGDSLPQRCEVIRVHVAELKQLFNAIDSSPFRERDLDPRAEEFIIESAREAQRDAPLALVVQLDRPAGLPEEPAALRDAVREYFRYRARVTRQRLRLLFRRGRISLLIGLAALAASIVLGDLIDGAMEGKRLGGVLRESLLIGGWVAMWKPLEVFLYDWWPIRAEARLHDRLSTMPVKIEYGPGAAPDAWRLDWPAVSPGNDRRRTHHEAVSPPHSTEDGL